jgi:D-alanyl-D-alanine carboxypeptidase
VSYEEGGNLRMATHERTQRSLESATIISRRRFLKQTAFATAVASVPFLAGRSAAFGSEKAKGADAALDRALKDLVAMEGGPPGVIAVIQRGKHREVHTFGVANVRTGRPMRIDDRMRIASVAKAFSGAVALSLVSKGALSLDDTIGDLLSGLPDPPPATWSEVTLRQLLNHTSGLPDFTGSDQFRNALIANPTQPAPPEKLITYAYDLNNGNLLFPPGSQYNYSNSDNIAVGLMVEEATGRTYESQLQKQIYGPLGLRRTTLPVGANLKKPFIHGYDVSPPPPPEDVSEDFASGLAWASGGGSSPPRPTSTPSSVATWVASSSTSGREGSNARSSRGEAPTRQDRARTRPGWGSSATRRAAGRSGATRVTQRATPSLRRPAQTGSAPPRCP